MSTPNMSVVKEPSAIQPGASRPVAQFDVYKNSNPATARTYPFVVDLQSAAAQVLPTRLVAPLMRLAKLPFKRVTRIMPVVAVRGQDHVVLMPELAGIDRGLLKKRVDSLTTHRDDLVAALDFLFTGV